LATHYFSDGTVTGGEPIESLRTLAMTGRPATRGHIAHRVGDATPTPPRIPLRFVDRVAKLARDQRISAAAAVKQLALSDPLGAARYEAGDDVPALARPTPASRPTFTSTAAERAFLDAAREVARERRLDLSSAVRVVAKERRDLVTAYQGVFSLAGH
jgi:hypothetical protein